MVFSVQDGRVCRDGEPFLALGANYLAPATGCQMWTVDGLDVVRDDFKNIAAAGLNTVRLFLFWRDFEPVEGQLDKGALRRLTEVVSAARECGLVCVVSLLTIWMNGQRLDPEWRAGRSLWRDASVLDRQEAFIRAVAVALRGFDNVLAFDIGDEISNVAPDEADTLSMAEVAAWYARLAGAVRQEAPGVLVLQANDASSVFGASAFGVDNTQALDLIGVHGFPTWAPGSIESTLSYKATNLTPFLVRFAAAVGVPFVDELSSYGVDEATAAAYLSASAASAIANGAAGVVVWCWKDIMSTDEPYRSRPAERSAGLHRLDDSAKPAMREYERLIRFGPALTLDRPRARIGLYLNERVRAGGSSYLDRGVGTLATFFSYILLTRAHLPFELVAGNLHDFDLVVCPSVEHLTLPDIERLESAARRGATVYLSLASHLHGFPGEHLTGAHIVDFALGDGGKSAVSWGTDEWPIDWSMSGCPTTMRPTSATVLARFADGSPALVANRVGAGQVLFSNVPFERQLDAPGRLAVAPWESFYHKLAGMGGVVGDWTCPAPDVEIIVGRGRADGRPRAIVVNHANAPVSTWLARRGAGRDRVIEVDLAAKGWAVVELREGERG